jgi:hypothetical protein
MVLPNARVGPTKLQEDWQQARSEVHAAVHPQLSVAFHERHDKTEFNKIHEANIII